MIPVLTTRWQNSISNEEPEQSITASVSYWELAARFLEQAWLPSVSWNDGNHHRLPWQCQEVISDQSSEEIWEWLLVDFQNTSVFWVLGRLNWLQSTHLLLNVWLLLPWKGAISIDSDRTRTLCNHLTLLIQTAELTMQHVFVTLACRIHPGHLFHSVFHRN